MVAVERASLPKQNFYPERSQWFWPEIQSETRRPLPSLLDLLQPHNIGGAHMHVATLDGAGACCCLTRVSGDGDGDGDGDGGRAREGTWSNQLDVPSSFRYVLEFVVRPAWSLLLFFISSIFFPQPMRQICCHFCEITRHIIAHNLARVPTGRGRVLLSC